MHEGGYINYAVSQNPAAEPSKNDPCTNPLRGRVAWGVVVL